MFKRIKERFGSFFQLLPSMPHGFASQMRPVNRLHFTRDLIAGDCESKKNE